MSETISRSERKQNEKELKAYQKDVGYLRAWQDQLESIAGAVNLIGLENAKIRGAQVEADMQAMVKKYGLSIDEMLAGKEPAASPEKQEREAKKAEAAIKEGKLELDLLHKHYNDVKVAHSWSASSNSSGPMEQKMKQIENRITELAEKAGSTPEKELARLHRTTPEDLKKKGMREIDRLKAEVLRHHMDGYEYFSNPSVRAELESLKAKAERVVFEHGLDKSLLADFALPEIPPQIQKIKEEKEEAKIIQFENQISSEEKNPAKKESWWKRMFSKEGKQAKLAAQEKTKFDSAVKAIVASMEEHEGYEAAMAGGENSNIGKELLGFQEQAYGMLRRNFDSLTKEQRDELLTGNSHLASFMQRVEEARNKKKTAEEAALVPKNEPEKKSGRRINLSFEHYKERIEKFAKAAVLILTMGQSLVGNSLDAKAQGSGPVKQGTKIEAAAKESLDQIYLRAGEQAYEQALADSMVTPPTLSGKKASHHTAAPKHHVGGEHHTEHAHKKLAPMISPVDAQRLHDYEEAERIAKEHTAAVADSMASLIAVRDSARQEFQNDTTAQETQTKLSPDQIAPKAVGLYDASVPAKAAPDLTPGKIRVANYDKDGNLIKDMDAYLRDTGDGIKYTPMPAKKTAAETSITTPTKPASIKVAGQKSGKETVAAAKKNVLLETTTADSPSESSEKFIGPKQEVTYPSVVTPFDTSKVTEKEGISSTVGLQEGILNIQKASPGYTLDLVETIKNSRLDAAKEVNGAKEIQIQDPEVFITPGGYKIPHSLWVQMDPEMWSALENTPAALEIYYANTASKEARAPYVIQVQKSGKTIDYLVAKNNMLAAAPIEHGKEKIAKGERLSDAEKSILALGTENGAKEFSFYSVNGDASFDGQVLETSMQAGGNSELSYTAPEAIAAKIKASIKLWREANLVTERLNTIEHEGEKNQSWWGRVYASRPERKVVTASEETSQHKTHKEQRKLKREEKHSQKKLYAKKPAKTKETTVAKKVQTPKTAEKAYKLYSYDTTKH